MLTTLPAAIGTYFAGVNARDFDTALSAFTKTALVHDEKEDHAGQGEIRAWIEATTAKYNQTSEILSSTPEGAGHLVSARVTGTFPGSPVTLRYRFTLDGEKIARLDIAP